MSLGWRMCERKTTGGRTPAFLSDFFPDWHRKNQRRRRRSPLWFDRQHRNFWGAFWEFCCAFFHYFTCIAG